MFISNPYGGGVAGADGTPAGLNYAFDTSTSMADPGAGDVRFNSATIGSVSQIAISDTDADANDLDGYLDQWDDSTSSVRGQIVIVTADLQVLVFNVTGAITDQGTWHQIPVGSGSGTLPSASEGLRIFFVRTGDKGETGATGAQGPQGDEGPPGDLSAAWPVGSVFLSVVSTNPGTLLGVGTWTAFGAGRMLVGRDAGQTEFDTVEETGGAKTHTLTTAEMPAHSHPGSTAPIAGAAGGFSSRAAPGNNAGTATSSVSVASQGGGGAHNNLPPYIVVYMWKRTA